MHFFAKTLFAIFYFGGLMPKWKIRSKNALSAI
jgi:hypothetical protein